MSHSDESYYRYMRQRSPLQFAIRREVFLRPLVRFFSGRLLDVGCGLGEFAKVYPNDYHGIDPNPFCVQMVSAQGHRCQIGTATSIPYPDHAFDTVLLSHVLEHLDEPLPALAEIRRVLRPSGTLCVIVPTEAGFQKDSTHRRFYDLGALAALVIDCGFRVQRTWEFPFPNKWFGRYLYFNEFRVLALKD